MWMSFESLSILIYEASTNQCKVGHNLDDKPGHYLVGQLKVLTKIGLLVADGSPKDLETGDNNEACILLKLSS